jgi:hypothetical protein
MDLITTTADLAAACSRLARHPFVTVDTEFMRETTYYPKLCLIQMATPDEGVLVDPLAPGIARTAARPRPSAIPPAATTGVGDTASTTAGTSGKVATHGRGRPSPSPARRRHRRRNPPARRASSAEPPAQASRGDDRGRGSGRAAPGRGRSAPSPAAPSAASKPPSPSDATMESRPAASINLQENPSTTHATGKHEDLPQPKTHTRSGPWEFFTDDLRTCLRSVRTGLVEAGPEKRKSESAAETGTPN